MELQNPQQKDDFFIGGGQFVCLDDTTDPILIGELIEQFFIAIVDDVDDAIDLHFCLGVNRVIIRVQFGHGSKDLLVHLWVITDDLSILQGYPDCPVEPALIELLRLDYVQQFPQLFQHLAHIFSLQFRQEYSIDLSDLLEDVEIRVVAKCLV